LPSETAVAGNAIFVVSGLLELMLRAGSVVCVTVNLSQGLKRSVVNSTDEHWQKWQFSTRPGFDVVVSQVREGLGLPEAVVA
jgi:hypothetical protein